MVLSSLGVGDRGVLAVEEWRSRRGQVNSRDLIRGSAGCQGLLGQLRERTHLDVPFCVGCGITTSLLCDLSRCSISGAEDGKALRKAVSVHRSDEKLAEGVLLPRRYLGEGGFL